MKKQHTVTKNNLKLQKIFFIGSFANVLLCYSKLFSRAEVYLVSDSRKNNRNTQLFLNISSKSTLKAQTFENSSFWQQQATIFGLGKHLLLGGSSWFP